jgi:hypothetical protein
VNLGRVSFTVPFIDLLFNLVLSLLSLFLLLIVLINPPKPVDGNTKLLGDYQLIIKWQDKSNHDVDLWLTNGLTTCSFVSRQTEFCSLERDDVGPDNTIDMTHLLDENKEVITIRKAIPGTYIAAIHFYAQRLGPDPIVQWALVKMQPHSKIVTSGVKTMSIRGQEITLIRFVIDSNGEIGVTDTFNQYPFMYR